MRSFLDRTTLLAAFACSALFACGGIEPSPPQLTQPPPPPTAPPAATLARRTFAMTKIFLGDTDRDGNVATTAWTKYGYDLDGKLTTKDSRDVCTPDSTSVNRDGQVDGEGGIDNAWGARILPLLETVTHDASVQMTATVGRGAYTYLFETEGLDDDPTQSNTLVAGQVFLAGALGHAPTFAPDESWPIAQGSLASGNVAGGAKARFATSYVTGGRWVSAPLGDLMLHVDVGAGGAFNAAVPAIDVTIHRALVTFDHVTPGRLTNGVIAGVISADDLVQAALPIVARVGGPPCGGTDPAGVVQLIRQAADMPLRGDNAASVTCDGISIGIGFEAAEVGNPAQVGPDPEPVIGDCGAPPIADAGAD